MVGSYLYPKSLAIVWGVISLPYLETKSWRSIALVEYQGSNEAFLEAPPAWLYLCKAIASPLWNWSLLISPFSNLFFSSSTFLRYVW